MLGNIFMLLDFTTYVFNNLTTTPGDDQGESPALEVLEYRNKDGKNYFACE